MKLRIIGFTKAHCIIPGRKSKKRGNKSYLKAKDTDSCVFFCDHMVQLPKVVAPYYAYDIMQLLLRVTEPRYQGETSPSEFIFEQLPDLSIRSSAERGEGGNEERKKTELRSFPSKEREGSKSSS